MIYVGIHGCSCKKCKYYSSGVRINRAVKKYGKNNFTRENIFEFDNYDDAVKKEAEIVDQGFIDRKDTYNMVLGGGNFQIGHKHSDETRHKIGRILSGRILSDETKLRISNNSAFKNGFVMPKESVEKVRLHNIGTKRSEETKQKMKDAWKKRKDRGWSLSDDARKKISDANSGKKLSHEIIENLRNISKNRIVSKETRLRMSVSAKNRWITNK